MRHATRRDGEPGEVKIFKGGEHIFDQGSLPRSNDVSAFPRHHFWHKLVHKVLQI
jgi:hypothetical protein